MRFKQFLLTEIFNSWKYQVPADKEHLLFDFYALTLVNPSRKATSEGGSKLITAREFDENLAIEFENAKETICNALIKEFKYTLLYSLSAEMRHILGKYDYRRWNSEEVIESLEAELSIKIGSIATKFIRLLDDIQKGSSDTPTRKESYEAMKELSQSLPPNLIAEFCKTLFLSGWWDNSLGASAYGGKAWGMIADAYAQLYTVTSLGDKIVLIDYIYDLQHNNGSVFTKLTEYAKDGNYKWLARALDYKRDLKDPMGLYHKVSTGLQGLFAYAMFTTTGKSLEKHEKEIAETKQLKMGDVLFIKPTNTHQNIYKNWQKFASYYYRGPYGNSAFKTLFSQLAGKRVRIESLYDTDRDNEGNKHNQYRVEYVRKSNRDKNRNVLDSFLVYDDIFDFSKAIIHDVSPDSFLKMMPPIKGLNQ